MEIKIFQDNISREELIRMAKEQFGDMVKAVVDIERKIMSVGGGLHADAESLLLNDGSKQEHLWGINIYPEKRAEERIEFHSMINIRPSQGNRSMEVESGEIRNQIRNIVKKIIL